ncbi:MAG TPA: ATP-dependent DNA helicase [Steroidobacter sp.]|nr:ATP-dependent DNA helicase [Steroidobacter sp.]
MTMHDYSDIFGEHGPLAAAIEGFTTRAEQIQMARAVADALRGCGRLIVEAGTGTGKTFAYLVPALLSGRRVIVSTGTRALQDQLFHRDLPTVSRALGRPVRVALLKGRANYLCLHRLDLAEQQAYARGLRRDVAAALGVVRDWARITRRGDIAELAQLGESDPVWPWVTSTRDNCLGVDCAFFDRCCLVQARRDAQAADVVVVNHHLLMADLVLKEEGFGDLLPGADAIVIDEAHQLAEIAGNFLGFTVSSRQLQTLARDFAAELLASGAAQQSASLAQTIEQRAFDVHGALRGMKERCEQHEWPAGVIETLERLQTALDLCAAALAEPAREHAGLASVRRRAMESSGRIAALLAQDEGEQASVRWAHATSSGVTFHYAPIDVAGQLGALIDAHARAWVFTSATLAVAGDFDHFMHRIGVKDATTLQLGSPFDFASRTLLYLPQGLDAPSSSRHTAQVVEAAWPVLIASGGRAFLLFTSHRALREAAALLRARLDAQPCFPLFVQGDAPRDVLLSRFREHGAAVLLGASSFWEGVDVKGAALCVVVIDKLPFAAPDDPVLKARLAAIERRGGNSFLEEQVPQAAIALKQGVGRLMRDQEDFGVIMLCDQRVRTRGYGRVFLDSLPRMPQTQRVEDVVAFLQGMLSAAGEDVSCRGASRPAHDSLTHEDWAQDSGQVKTLGK